MRFIDAIDRFVYRSSRTKLIAALLALAFVKTGVWYIPNFDGWKGMRLDPFHNPFPSPDAHYLFWNWLGPFLAWRFRIHNEQSFLYFHLFFSIAFTASFLAYVFFQFEERDARTVLVLFFAIPVSVTAYFWIGMDSITLALMMLLLVARSHRLLALLLGIALGMQHAEQGVVAFAALLFALVLSRILNANTRYSITWAAMSLLGVGIGKLILILVFRHYGVVVNSGRFFYMRRYGAMYATMFWYHFQYALWAVLGVGWIAVAKFAERGRAAIPFLSSLCLMMLMLPVVGDETRVMGIVTFPLLAVYLLLNPEFLRTLSSTFVAWIFGLWLLIPLPWAWGGRPVVSIFPYNITYLLHRMFGWFSVPADPSMWPFLN
jgi:hypothetical protein